MRKLLIALLVLFTGCVSVRVQTGESNTSDKKDNKELTGIDAGEQ